MGDKIELKQFPFPTAVFEEDSFVYMNNRYDYEDVVDASFSGMTVSMANGLLRVKVKVAYSAMPKELVIIFGAKNIGKAMKAAELLEQAAARNREREAAEAAAQAEETEEAEEAVMPEPAAPAEEVEDADE